MLIESPRRKQPLIGPPGEASQSEAAFSVCARVGSLFRRNWPRINAQIPSKRPGKKWSIYEGPILMPGVRVPLTVTIQKVEN